MNIRESKAEARAKAKARTAATWSSWVRGIRQQQDSDRVCEARMAEERWYAVPSYAEEQRRKRYAGLFRHVAEVRDSAEVPAVKARWLPTVSPGVAEAIKRQGGFRNPVLAVQHELPPEVELRHKREDGERAMGMIRNLMLGCGVSEIRCGVSEQK